MLTPDDSSDDRSDDRAPVDAVEIDGGLTITAYAVNRELDMPIVRAGQDRAWMDSTRMRFAYRCLPMLIANQHGWFILNSQAFTAIWDGGEEVEAIHLAYEGHPPYPALTHFGHGVLTFNIPYLFRTPPGFNLVVRGPANQPKDGIAALDGIVETDWSHATFTMNWLFTRARQPVRFEKGEPICMIYPVRRGDIESFVPELCDISAHPEQQRLYTEWADGRSRFNAELKIPGSEAARRLWQKDYFQGRAYSGRVPDHQTRLRLRAFKRGR